jgi:hypothetical protein
MSQVSYTASERLSRWDQEEPSSRPGTFICSKETNKAVWPNALSSQETRKVPSEHSTVMDHHTEYEGFSDQTESVVLHQHTVTQDAPLFLNALSSQETHKVSSEHSTVLDHHTDYEELSDQTESVMLHQLTVTQEVPLLICQQSLDAV